MSCLKSKLYANSFGVHNSERTKGTLNSKPCTFFNSAFPKCKWPTSHLHSPAGHRRIHTVHIHAHWDNNAQGNVVLPAVHDPPQRDPPSLRSNRCFSVRNPSSTPDTASATAPQFNNRNYQSNTTADWAWNSERLTTSSCGERSRYWGQRIGRGRGVPHHNCPSPAIPASFHLSSEPSLQSIFGPTAAACGSADTSSQGPRGPKEENRRCSDSRLWHFE